MTYKSKRRLFFLLTKTFSFVVPTVAIIIRYQMIQAFLEAPNGTKVSIIGLITILGLFIFNFRSIINYLNEMEYSLIKCLFNGFLKTLPLVIVLGLLIMMDKILSDLIFTFSWIAGGNLIAFLVFDPLYQKYTFKIKREARIQEVREALN